MGLHRAGFDVVGVDINLKRAKRYPFRFIHGDALRPPVDFGAFDFIWASPPCQHYTQVWNGRSERRVNYPELIEPVRDLLKLTGIPFVIENVPPAPIRADVVLTGAQFGLDIVRRRHFEIEGLRAPFALAPACHWEKRVKNGGLASVAGQGANNPYSWSYGISWRDLPMELKRCLARKNTAEAWREAMGIDWMTRDELRESVPPAYSEFIARAALEQIAAQEG